ncbi:MAG TPA: MFS transporter [Methanoregulaceae archaeon]|nr:MFS transporter [Methanoregulaceae archaeon]HPD75839.1 MFS transporter [Methanoregulaceae archaeon]HRY75695.1 MFS transporter [Methanoregulaceae archaeon]
MTGQETASPIAGLAAAHLVTDIYMPVLPAILPLLVSVDGYSYFAAGLLITAYNITSSFTQPIIGWLSDAKGFSISVGISLLVSAVFVSLIGIAHDYSMIMAFAVLAALGHACFHPTALSLVSRLCTSENRGRITSYFVVGGNLGYAIGPVLTGILVWWFGLPGLIFLCIPAIAMVVALRFLLPSGIAVSCNNRTAPEKTARTESMRPFAILLAASIFRAWAIFAAMTYIPLYLVSQGFSLVAATAVTTLMLLAGVIGQAVGGRISDRIGRKEFLILGLAGAAPAFYLFLTSSGILSIIAVLIFGFCLWSTFAVAVAMGHELMPGNIGLASGMMLGLAIGAGGLGVAVNGFVADHYSLATALGTVPVPIVIAIILMALVPYPWKTWRKKAAGSP